MILVGFLTDPSLPLMPARAAVLSIVEMYKTGLSVLVILLASVLGFNPSFASDSQSLASIQLQSEAFIARYPYSSPYAAQFELSRLDKRLKLKACAKPLAISFTRPDKVMGNTSLTVRCETPVNWQIHLPVRIDIYDDVLVSKTPLSKGQIIDARDVVLRKENIARLNQGFLRQTKTLENLEIKRNLPAQSILTPALLSPRKLVKAGQKVTIMLEMQGMQIKTSGFALQSASRGQTIKVRNSRSNKIVEGIVEGYGQIRVTL